jgi:hypothetical protein
MPHFILGPPPKNEMVDNARWHRVEDYGSSGRQMLVALSVGVVVALCIGLIWRALDPNALPLGQPSLADFFIVIAIAIVGHEGLHLLGFPGAGFTRHSVCGIWPGAGSAFVQHLQPMTRTRFLIATLLPFLVISILPISIQALGFSVGNVVAWTSTLNAVGCGADILAAALLFKTVPKQARILESSHILYWSM